MTYKAYNGVELMDELLDEMATEYERGDWSGHIGPRHAGRPRFGEEKLVPVTVKLAPSTRDGLDAAAKAAHQSRSAFIRATLEQAVQKFVDQAAVL
jgi:dihydroorotate dehydrogenase